MPWYRDLELERHGATLHRAGIERRPDPEGRPDAGVVDGFRADARIVRAVQRAGRGGAQAVARRFRADRARDPGARGQSPPLPPEQRRALLERTAEGRRLLEVSRLSPLEFVQREFEHPTIRAGLLFFNGLREVDLRVRGFGHHIPALLAGRAKAQMCVGGSAVLARALESAVRESGGTTRLRTTPRRILVENGRAVGVETDGRRTVPRPALRRLAPQPAADVPGVDGRGRRTGRLARKGEAVSIQPAGPAVRPEPQPRRAASL